jgi:hypothetical protein
VVLEHLVTVATPKDAGVVGLARDSMACSYPQNAVCIGWPTPGVFFILRARAHHT